MPIRTSSRQRNPPGEWWKVQNSEQFRDPRLVLPDTDDKREAMAQQQQQQQPVFPELAEDNEEDEALITEGLNFVYALELNQEEALEYAYNTRANALPEEPRSFKEAMSGPHADK